LGQRMHDAFETLLKWVIKTVLSLAVTYWFKSDRYWNFWKVDDMMW
jgi:hypothetical protein